MWKGSQGLFCRFLLKLNNFVLMYDYIFGNDKQPKKCFKDFEKL